MNCQDVMFCLFLYTVSIGIDNHHLRVSKDPQVGGTGLSPESDQGEKRSSRTGEPNVKGYQ